MGIILYIAEISNDRGLYQLSDIYKFAISACLVFIFVERKKAKNGRFAKKKI